MVRNKGKLYVLRERRQSNTKGKLRLSIGVRPAIVRFSISSGATSFFISDGTNFHFAFFNLQSAMLITPPALTQ